MVRVPATIVDDPVRPHSADAVVPAIRAKLDLSGFPLDFTLALYVAISVYRFPICGRTLAGTP